jgi:hypothetical protein
LEFIENFDPKRYRGRTNRGPAGAEKLFDAWEDIVQIDGKRGKQWDDGDTLMMAMTAYIILCHWPESKGAKYWREQLAPLEMTYGDLKAFIDDLAQRVLDEEDAA